LKEAQKRALLLTVQIDDFITRLDILKGYRVSRLPFFPEIKIAEVDVSFAEGTERVCLPVAFPAAGINDSGRIKSA